MALLSSKGLKTLLNTGLKTAIDSGVIEIRSGVKPASPNDAATGTLLLLITLNGASFTPGSATNGLVFAVDPGTGKLTIPSGAVWRGTAVANGVATWFRHKGNATDAGLASTTLPRIDGTVAQTGGDLGITSTTMVTGAVHTVDRYIIGAA